MDMSFRTVQRIGLMSVLALSSVFSAACGDDEKKDTNGGDGDGDGDGNGDGDGAKSDAGSDAAVLPELAVMCGTNVCPGVKLATPPNLNGCCLENNECGIESARLTATDKPACVPKDAPGVASTSCTGVWDQVDFEAETGKTDAGVADNKTDMKFTAVAAPGILAQFDGCCTAAGECSINYNSVSVVVGGNAVPGVTNVGYGCPDPKLVGLDLASMGAGFGESITCDATTGMITETPAAP